jgi:phosphatidylinositol alpha-mannosyltransferase
MHSSSKSPLRVCIVVPYDLSERGGVKHHAFEVANALREGGDHVSIVGPATEDPELPDVMSFGGIVNVRSNNSDNRMALFVSPWKLRKFFREGNFDVIHVHEPPIPSLPYWTAWVTPGIAKICTFHAFNETPSWGIHFGQKVCQLLSERFYDHSLTVSQAAHRHASYAWNKPLTIVPNGVATDVFVPGAPRAAESGRAGRTGQPLRLLFVGRISDERKGFRYMLEAYEQLLARGVAVTLDVVGERAGGPPPPALPGLTYHGSVSRSELVRRFQECDLYVAPSTGSESFGIVLLEAMATGAPLVCTSIEGYRAVAHADGAVLVPPRSSAAIVTAVEQLAADPARRVAMGAVNLEHVKSFAWSVVASRVREEYLVAIDNRARRGAARRPVLAPSSHAALELAPGLPDAMSGAVSGTASLSVLPSMQAIPSASRRGVLGASEHPAP